MSFYERALILHVFDIIRAVEYSNYEIMWPWGRAAYDNGEVSLIKLLPKGDEPEFMRFVFPLRARAAVFFATLELLYEVVNTLLSAYLFHDKFSGKAIAYLAINIGLELILLLTAIFASAVWLSRIVHAWYIVMVAIRLLSVAPFAFLGENVDLVNAVAYLVFVLLLDTAIGTTMHIHFLLFLLLSFPDITFILIAMVNSDDSSIQVGGNIPVLLTIAVGLYILALWTVHTVQVRSFGSSVGTTVS